MGRHWPPFPNFCVPACLAACSGLPFCLTAARSAANLAPLRTKESNTCCVLYTQNTTHSYKSARCFLKLLLAPIQSVTLHFDSGRNQKTKSIWGLILVIYFGRCGSSSSSIYLFFLSVFLLTFEVFAILMLQSMCCCNGFLLEIH